MAGERSNGRTRRGTRGDGAAPPLRIAVVGLGYIAQNAGRSVHLDPLSPPQRPMPGMEISKPPLRREPSRVRVSPPHPD